MQPPDPPYLFAQQELRALLESKKHELLSEIDRLSEDYILNGEREKLCEYFQQ